MAPETHYAKTADGVHIAYQTLGEGPGLVYVPGHVFDVEALWSWPIASDFARSLAGFARLAIFDPRGTGMSDHIVPRERQWTLEARMDDLRAVMDAADLERAVLFSFEEGFALSALFAATYPERTIGLVGQAPVAASMWSPDYPWGWTDEQWEQYIEKAESKWGTIAHARHQAAVLWPELGENPEWIRQFARWMQRTSAPGDVVAFKRAELEMDVRDVLPAIRVPTLFINRVDNQAGPIEETRFIASRVPGARLVELPGSNHPWSSPDQHEIIAEVERFVRTLTEEEAELDRVLATILFTDIVGSTERVVEIGDRRWHELVQAHHDLVRSLLARFRGREVDTAGDGFLATFDGPARAVRCAGMIADSVRSLGLEIRAGIHTGECEVADGKIRGVAVHVGARVAALAAPGEVVVSSTVKDLVAGSGLSFEDRGIHELKGIPGRWQVYAVASS
jgi:class 3 adenylate cyclase